MNLTIPDELTDALEQMQNTADPNGWFYVADYDEAIRAGLIERGLIELVIPPGEWMNRYSTYHLTPAGRFVLNGIQHPEVFCSTYRTADGTYMVHWSDGRPDHPAHPAFQAWMDTGNPLAADPAAVEANERTYLGKGKEGASGGDAEDIEFEYEMFLTDALEGLTFSDNVWRLCAESEGDIKALRGWLRDEIHDRWERRWEWDETYADLPEDAPESAIDFLIERHVSQCESQGADVPLVHAWRTLAATGSEGASGPGSGIECEECGLLNDADADACEQCGVLFDDTPAPDAYDRYKNGIALDSDDFWDDEGNDISPMADDEDDDDAVLDNDYDDYFWGDGAVDSDPYDVDRDGPGF